MAAQGQFPMGLSAGLPVEGNLHIFLQGCALYAYGPSVVTSVARAEFASANLTRAYGLRSLQQISRIIYGHENIREIIHGHEDETPL